MIYEDDKLALPLDFRTLKRLRLLTIILIIMANKQSPPPDYDYVLSLPINEGYLEYENQT